MSASCGRCTGAQPDAELPPSSWNAVTLLRKAQPSLKSTRPAETACRHDSPRSFDCDLL